MTAICEDCIAHVLSELYWLDAAPRPIYIADYALAEVLRYNPHYQVFTDIQAYAHAVRLELP